MSTPKRWSIRLAVALVVAVTSSPATAQIDKCQAGLAKNSQKLEVAFAKGFEKCLGAIRKGIVKGKPAADAAASCEKTLDKLTGLGPTLSTKTKIGKFVAALKKLETNLVCTATDLPELGHMVSGVNAPGTDDVDFVASWMAVVKQSTAWTENVLDNAAARDLIDLAINAGPEDDDPLNCDPVKGGGCGTFCGVGAPPAGDFSRPNLCALSPGRSPQCRTVACNLRLTGANLQPIGAPISFADRKFAMDVCTPPDADLPVTSPGFLMLSGSPNRTMRTAPVIPTAPPITWCIDQVRAEGWCDCAAAAPAVPYLPESCVDHNADAGGTCPDTGAALETDCVCTSPAGQPCSQSGCTACRHAKTGASCHPGTLNTPINIKYTGASTINACLYLSTLQFRFLAPATCVNLAGEPLTRCNAAGPATPDCIALGGTSCVASVGPDLIACTADDRPAAMATVTIPFTTGTAKSTIEHSVTNSGFNLEGQCLSGNVGMNCMTDDDCDNDLFTTTTCGAFTPGCPSSPPAPAEDCSFTTGLGLGPASCGALQAGNLTNFALTGSLPTLEDLPQLADYIINFKLDCE